MYNADHVLKTPLLNVECWNCTNGSTASFNRGETIRALHVYDKYNTVIECKEPEGRPLTDKDGTPGNGTLGYRFIVPNLALAFAIDAHVSLESEDLVGDIIAYESGELASPKRLFKKLKESGIGNKLQGYYSSRM